VKLRAGGFISQCPQVGCGLTGGGTQREMAEMTSTAVILFQSPHFVAAVAGLFGRQPQ